MCGINGFTFEDQNLIQAMNKSILHRGPNGQGTYVSKSISLGQVRLSILDLSIAGHQPMFYSKTHGAASEKYHPEHLNKATVSIVFNGEVYNYIELKQELIKKKYVFTTESDTEVILAAYLAWGEDCVNRFNGMWAFCIYDQTKQVLFCSRDRVGKKPLYYYHNDKTFIFSSELKALLEHKSLQINTEHNLNSTAIELYFSVGFVPAPLTIYNNVFKLQSAHNLVFSLKTGKLITKQYYDLPKFAPEYDREKLISEGRELLKDAVRLRMRSDVPVGAFLSGGLDSSTVVGEMKQLTDISKLHTFSVGFEGKYDETSYINLVKDYFGTKHHHYYFKEKDFIELIDTYSFSYDEPFADFSGFPTHKVSELAKEFVTVVLTGDGGDEIFGGYTNHVLGYRMDIINRLPRMLRWLGSKIPVTKNLNSVANLYLLKEAFTVSLSEKNAFYAKALENEGIKPESYKKWSINNLKLCLKKGDNKLGEALRINDLLFQTLPDNFLVKVDRAMMHYAVEGRSPFLDYRLLEFSQKIPTSWKQNSFKTKILMREIIKGIVPQEIVNRGKQGFTPPLEEWILQDKYLKQLNRGRVVLRNVNPSLAKFYDEKVFKEKNKIYTQYKIRLFLFTIWWNKWLSQ